MKDIVIIECFVINLIVYEEVKLVFKGSYEKMFVNMIWRIKGVFKSYVYEICSCCVIFLSSVINEF